MSNVDGEVILQHRGCKVRVSQKTLDALEKERRILDSQVQSTNRPLVRVFVTNARGPDGEVTTEVHYHRNGFFHI